MAKRRVLVGLPAGSGEQDGTPLVVIGAANEFGAKITIPERQATITRQVKANGEFANGGRFKKNGNFQTEHIIPAHTVTIPERSFLRVPLHQNQDNIKKAFRALTGKVTRGEITAFKSVSGVNRQSDPRGDNRISDAGPDRCQGRGVLSGGDRNGYQARKCPFNHCPQRVCHPID